MSICVKQYDINNFIAACIINLWSCAEIFPVSLSLITVQAIGRMFVVIWAVLSTLLGNLGDSRFGPYFPVSRSEYEISRIIAKVKQT